MDNKCSALEYLREVRPDAAAEDVDYVQVYLDNQCRKPARIDGAGPAGIHLAPDEGMEEIRRWYVPADGKAYRLKLRYCQNGVAGQIAQVTIGEVSNPRPKEDAPPPAPAARTDYLDPTATTALALGHAIDVGAQAMEVTRRADEDRTNLASMVVTTAREGADRTVDLVVKLNATALEDSRAARKELREVVGEYRQLAELAFANSNKQIEAADKRAQAAHNAATPAGLFMQYGPVVGKVIQGGKWLVDQLGGIEGIKEKIGGVIAKEVVGEGGGLIEGARSLLREGIDGMKELELHRAALAADDGGEADDGDDDAIDVEVEE